VAAHTAARYVFYAATPEASKLGRQIVTEQQHLTSTSRVDHCGAAM
jgi:hypothetical protein